MKRTDDELNAVDAEFLGPSGYTLPWRARYSAYGVGLSLAVVVFAVVHRLGVPVNAFTVVWATLLVVVVTRWVGYRVSFESPLRCLPVVAWLEMTAPRPRQPAVGAVLRPGRVRVRDGSGRPVCTGCESCQGAA